ncbi:MAG TPA: hypothetical protein VJJ52_02795 [Candidatus Nanoarchaeia archaeon]|nr:hypothetical protein [Candidatus Nanoarchaeia archaeon]
MNNVSVVLDDLVGFLIKRVPAPVIIDSVSRAHSAEIDETMRLMVEMVHESFFWDGGLSNFAYRKPENKTLRTVYQRFKHLIPEEYKTEGVKRAEEPKEVKYDQDTGTFYAE